MSEVTTTEKYELTPETQQASEQATADDIIIPKILLMQGTSKWVPDKFAQGDIINSLDEMKLGGKDKPVNILPFYLMKTWESFKTEEPDKNAWLESIPWNPGNDDLEWEYMAHTERIEKKWQGAVEAKRAKQYAFYCLLVDAEVESYTPLIVAFRSSSGFKDGKKIASHFATMKGLKQPAHNVIWSLTTETVKDEKNKRSFQKWVVKKVRNATVEEMNSCTPWLAMVSSGAVKEHAVEEKEEVVPETTTELPKAGPAKKPAPKAKPEFTADDIPF